MSAGLGVLLTQGGGSITTTTTTSGAEVKLRTAAIPPITISTTSWVPASTTHDLVIPAAVDDVLEYQADARCHGTESVETYMIPAVVDSAGAVLCAFTEARGAIPAGAIGVASGLGTSGFAANLSGSRHHKVVAGDIDADGNVRVRLFVRGSNTGSRKIGHDAFRVALKNYGPQA